MEIMKAIGSCHVRSAIYRTSKGKRYWKNNTVALIDQIPAEEHSATDWKEYDPRDDDKSSLFMFND